MQGSNDFRTKVRHWQYQWQKFTRNCWPINWDSLFKFNLLYEAIAKAGYALKVILITCLVGIIFSLTFLSLGAFQVFTVRVAAQGGEFREALVGVRVNTFNPVLDSTEAEKKIINLLYHPLYRVNYPDYLSNPKAQPEIIPILLTQAPTWEANPDDPSNPYYSLEFELRDDIKWSDGNPITNQDVAYSFERIKEGGGNSNFQGVFSNYNLEIIRGSSTRFRITPKSTTISPNPQLIYLANFYPVSSEFYSVANSGIDKIRLGNQSLQTNLKSTRVTVTSGYFKMAETGSENPTWSNQFGGYNKIILEPNDYQNTGEEVFLSKYIFDLYESIEDTGGVQSSSLQRAAVNQEVDLYTRFLDASSMSSANIKQSLGTNQILQDTNTFYSLFLNIQGSGSGLTGYFINQNLRRYVICQFIDLDSFQKEGFDSFEILPINKRFLPLQFGEDYTIDCSNARQALTDYITETGQNVYSFTKDERNNLTSLNIFGNQPTFTLLGLKEFESYAQNVQTKLLEAGLKVRTDLVSSEELESKLSQKNYHILLLPITLLSKNPYPTYGLSGQNVSNITRNDRVEGRQIEEKLKLYSESNLQDETLKSSLVDFFKTEYIGVNLFRAKREINYSNKANNIDQNLNEFMSFSYDIYNFLPNWYIETKRKIVFL